MPDLWHKLTTQPPPVNPPNKEGNLGTDNGVLFLPTGKRVSTIVKMLYSSQWGYIQKDTPSPNVIPQPVVRTVVQRAGTNILDIDFEILDSDDAIATAGIIASVDGNFDDLTKLIIPTSLAEGSGK